MERAAAEADDESPYLHGTVERAVLRLLRSSRGLWGRWSGGCRLGADFVGLAAPSRHPPNSADGPRNRPTHRPQASAGEELAGFALDLGLGGPGGEPSRLAVFAMRWASRAARRARHGMPGRPSVSTAARSSPPIMPTFLRNCRRWLRFSSGHWTPRTDGRRASSAPSSRRGRLRQPGQRSGGEHRAADHVHGGVDPDQRSGIGRDLRRIFLQQRRQTIGHGLGPLDYVVGITQRLQPLHDEQRREHRAGDESNQGHAHCLPRKRAGRTFVGVGTPWQAWSNVRTVRSQPQRRRVGRGVRRRSDRAA